MVYADYHTQIMSGVQLICPVSRCRNLSWKLATVKFLDAPLMFFLAFQATFQDSSWIGDGHQCNTSPFRIRIHRNLGIIYDLGKFDHDLTATEAWNHG